MQEITMHQLGRALVRCPACADSAVPDLPALAAPPTIGELVAVGAVSREWLPYREGGE